MKTALCGGPSHCTKLAQTLRKSKIFVFDMLPLFCHMIFSIDIQYLGVRLRSVIYRYSKMWRVDLRIENRTIRGSLSLREARANVAEIKDLCLGHVTLRTLRPLLKKIQGHWHTNGVINITRVSLLAHWVEPVRCMIEKT